MPARSQYDFSEWASEIDLPGAHLEGFYHWVPPPSIANLENFMASDSVDIYSRAKIIGSYSKSIRIETSLTDAQKNSHLRHMRWFIENLPQSQFISTFDINELRGYDQATFEALRDLFLETAKENSKSLSVLVNVNAALARADAQESKRLERVLGKVSPVWAERIQLLLGRPPAKREVDYVLQSLWLCCRKEK